MGWDQLWPVTSASLIFLLSVFSAPKSDHLHGTGSFPYLYSCVRFLPSGGCTREGHKYLSVLLLLHLFRRQWWCEQCSVMRRVEISFSCIIRDMMINWHCILHLIVAVFWLSMFPSWQTASHQVGKPAKPLQRQHLLSKPMAWKAKRAHLLGLSVETNIKYVHT